MYFGTHRTAEDGNSAEDIMCVAAVPPTSHSHTPPSSTSSFSLPLLLLYLLSSSSPVSLRTPWTALHHDGPNHLGLWLNQCLAGTTTDKRLKFRCDSASRPRWAGKALPLPCACIAFAAETLSLHWVSTAFVAKTLPCVSTVFVAKTLVFALCFHCLRSLNSVFVLCPHCIRF